jgi:hypothetical protein
MQMFGWYYFFQIITILLCIFVKGEDNVDFDYINKTVKVNIYYFQTILIFKNTIIIFINEIRQ